MMVMYVMILIICLIALLCCLLYILSLRRKMREMMKFRRMKEVFLENIGNEIHVPLDAMKALAETVSKEDLYLSKNEKRNISDQINYNATLIKTMFDEIVMFSGNNDEGNPLHIDSFSPNALCRRCLEANVYSIYHRQAVKLNFKRELSDEFFVKNDRHLVELILNKLILNACRFTEVGEITVGCNTSEHTGRLTIFVEDTGVGIPENRLNNLFTWFEEPDDMHDAAELDLSICHRLAQKIGGVLYMDENYLRKGSRLVFILPLR